VAGSRRDPAGWVGTGGAGGIDRDGTVTAAIPPGSPRRRTVQDRAAAGPAGRTSSAPRRPLPHWSPVPVSHFTSLSAQCRRHSAKAAGRSPVPVAHGTIPSCRCIYGRYRVAHRIRLRTAHSSLVVRSCDIRARPTPSARSRSSGACEERSRRVRSHIPARAADATAQTRARCATVGRVGDARCGDRLTDPGSHRCTALLSSSPPAGDTSVVTRLPSAAQGVEPRMNGRAVEEVRGCAAVTA
jgi:hypothetical protein